MKKNKTENNKNKCVKDEMYEMKEQNKSKKSIIDNFLHCKYVAYMHAFGIPNKTTTETMDRGEKQHAMK